MKYAYVRVSTQEQNIGRQLDFIKELGLDIPKKRIFVDKVSSRGYKRPAYEALKSLVESGDEVYIKELDRLGRLKEDTKKELLWFREKGVRLRICNLPTTMIDFKDNDWVLEMINNILIEVYTSIADNELASIRRRQEEGYASARARGQTFGRPFVKTELVEKARAMYETKQYSYYDLGRMFGVSYNTVRNWVVNPTKYDKK